ncbi:MAG: acetyl-CoA carboxylase carboxyltransferase subunit alpha [Candidatus Fraserbacteria bacterium RBG_16_55_9]|uniref:Acetyl-coenzyme A carboxylase carboxyl transferase subunit alpha n=1 Tax=Fraserbacteria sp. (strain RBG_16_55_9) TaxID=1817864 RepID=A0A1F5UUF9_FRAXR|nr:MAG: acetyl-CoA carboxylase carboxyltransferase subunit alpha [Candidatus Fraserbacteria bacterium RBG_16_55_9]
MAGKPSASIHELEKKIEELKALSRVDGIDLSDEISRLKAKLETLRTPTAPKELDDWERVKLARHPKRPFTLDYLEEIMDDFYELRGDRLYGDDRAIVTSLARFEGRTVVAIGNQKGRTAEENRERNFGMSHPEGYRKALRAMKLAERFQFPIVSFIDTPGAYPGIASEERHIGGALAQNIYEMFQLPVPIVVAILGEGGSGGALGIGVGDRVLMMENAIYSVISPEGCAAILWRDRAKAPDAARALQVTAERLRELKVIDEIIPEPPGGAQSDYEAAAQSLKGALLRNLEEIESFDTMEMLQMRRQKFQTMGVYEELVEAVEPPASSRGR